MAALSFIGEDSELRISELLEGGNINISIGVLDSQAGCGIKLDTEDIRLVAEWIKMQLKKIDEQKSNG